MGKTKGTFWILLFILLGLALYQIVVIFWEAPSKQETGRWYSMAQPDLEANLLRPREIYFTLGGEDGSFGKISKQDEAFEEVFQNAYDLFGYVLESSELQAVTWEELPWNREICVLSYALTLESDLVQQQLELERTIIEGKWSEIWVIPAQSREESSMVYLLDKEEQICLKAESKTWDQTQNHVLLEFLQQQAAKGTRDYFAVEKAWPELAGAYLPEDAVHEEAYTVQAAVNVLMGDRLNLVQAKQYALQFFQYTDTVKMKEGDNQLLCTNEKITVKIDNTGVIHYVETLTEEEKTPITMKEAFQLAEGFVKADLQWETAYGLDVIFSGYEIREDQYIFYFNYLFGDIPFQMNMADTDKAELGMAFPIRVTVEGSRVRHYERYVLSATIDANSRYTLVQNWKDIMNETAELGKKIIGVPELKYNYENGRMVLYWEIETDQGNLRYKAH